MTLEDRPPLIPSVQIFVLGKCGCVEIQVTRSTELSVVLKRGYILKDKLSFF